MPDQLVNFGVIGCGLMGREFASASLRWLHLLGDIPRPAIIAACDTTIDASARRAAGTARMVRSA